MACTPFGAQASIVGWTPSPRHTYACRRVPPQPPGAKPRQKKGFSQKEPSKTAERPLRRGQSFYSVLNICHCSSIVIPGAYRRTTSWAKLVSNPGHLAALRNAQRPAVAGCAWTRDTRPESRLGAGTQAPDVYSMNDKEAAPGPCTFAITWQPRLHGSSAG